MLRQPLLTALGLWEQHGGLALCPAPHSGLSGGHVLLYRPMLPVHEDHRARSVSPSAVGAGELMRADC